MVVRKSKLLDARVGDERAHDVVLLDQDGMSERAIARSLGCGRNTVRRLLAAHALERQEGAPLLKVKPPSARATKLDTHMDALAKLLARYPDITAQRVFEDLRAGGYDGGYTMVRERVSLLRPKAPAISLPTPEYRPGEMSESDWSSYLIDFSAGRRRVHVCSYVLVWSRRKAFSIHAHEDTHELMEAHRLAFERLGGVAARTKYDRQKAVVLRFEGTQPIYNPRFIAFATYYEFSPHICRKAAPNEKPRTERSFWELERSFLNGRSFFDVADMKQQLVGWQDDIADVRVPRGQRVPILGRFAEEAPHLRPLPCRPYDTARVIYRICDSMGCIAWDGNLYEVPYEHVTDFLPVRITSEQVVIYGRDLSCVATHQRLPKGLHERARLPGRDVPQRPRGADLDVLRPAFDALGDGADAYLRGLEGAHSRSAAHHARKILTLRERYTTGDLLAALRHAQRYGAFEHTAVARILETTARPRTLDEYVADATRQKLEHWLGECRTEPRELHEYDDLPCIRPRTPEKAPCPNNHHDALRPLQQLQHPDPLLPLNPETSCADDSSDTSGSSGSST
jgi:transposase